MHHSDIDIYCVNSTQANEVLARIQRTSKTEIKHKTSNAVTMSCSIDNHEWAVQLIIKHHFSKPEHIVETFDITVCQIVTDGKNFILGEHTAYDIKHKLLRIEEVRNESMKRFAKYYAYGYTPVAGLFDELVSNPDAVQWYELEEDYSGL